MNTGLLQHVLSGDAPPLFPLSAEQLHRMQTMGILPPEQPVELIDGILVRKDRSFRGDGPMVHNPGHAGAVSHIHRVLDRRTELVGCHARSQLPLTLDADNEPELDVKVVDGDASSYWLRHPTPADVRLVVEVAHTTLEYDRTVKLRLFARAGIVRYWIVNLVDHQIEAFWSPLSDQAAYQEQAIFKSGEVLMLELPRGPIEIAFDDLLPVRFRG